MRFLALVTLFATLAVAPVAFHAAEAQQASPIASPTGEGFLAPHPR